MNETSNIHVKQLLEINNISQKIEYCNKILNEINNRDKLAEKDDAIREKAADLQQNLLILERKYFSALSYENAKKELIELSKEKLLSNTQRQSLSGKTETLLKKINSFVLQIDDLRTKKEVEFKIYSLDEHRKLLKDEEPCPLCGSPYHPFAHEKELFDLGKTEAQIMSLNKDLHLAQKEYVSATAHLSSLTSIIASLDKQMDIKNTLIYSLEKENPEFKTSPSITKDIKSDSENTKSELVGLQNEIESRILLTFIERCREVLNELNGTSNAYIEINAERQKLYSGHDINGDADRIQNKYISSRDVCKEWKVTLSNALDNKEKLTKLHDQREIKLKQNLFKLGYKDIITAISDLLDDAEYQKLILEKEALVKSETELTNSLNTLQSEYDAIIIPEGSESEPDVLKKIIIQLNNEKDTLNHTNGAITNELKINEEALQTIAKSEIMLKQKNDAASVWFILDNLIGDATGNKYARYAQNLSLRHLIDLANKRLSKLSDRYLLIHTDIESDLTVTDLYQGKIKRSVKTLSGGESFIVSLALALSLADMASQNVKLESLFIDEGFGTLDAETLEIAIETLERLQSESNRTIGIISHVESLKERITTQIRVNKNAGGYATVEVIG